MPKRKAKILSATEVPEWTFSCAVSSVDMVHFSTMYGSGHLLGLWNDGPCGDYRKEDAMMVVVRGETCRNVDSDLMNETLRETQGSSGKLEYTGDPEIPFS